MKIEQLAEMLRKVKKVCDTAVADQSDRSTCCQGWAYHTYGCYINYFQEIAEALEGLDE